MLNWAIARGTVPIPRSGSLGHQKENIDVFDFKLTKEEYSYISGLNKNYRICADRVHTNHYNFFV